MTAAAAAPTGTATLFGLAGLLVLLAVLAHLAARRAGGWRTVRRALRREAGATAAAFAAPVRNLLRHRRALRLLGRLLGDQAGWADAERAALGAAQVPRVRPYGVLLGPTALGVLVACGPAPVPGPPEPWVADGDDPRLWWIDRSDAARLPTGARPAPLLAAFGTDGGHAVLLDLACGPAVTEIGGDRSTARAVLQAVAAQLDTRLPTGAVTVAAGVHPRHEGPDPAAALAAAGPAGAGGRPAFVVCARAPEEAAAPAGVRLLTLGGARGSARLVTADRGALEVRGTGLRIDPTALAAATARNLRLVPPYPAFDAGPADDGDLVEALPALPAGPDRPTEEPVDLPGRSAVGRTLSRPEPSGARHPDGPDGPDGPGLPVAPGVSDAPVGAVGPFGPARPTGSAAPKAPGGPVSPAAPRVPGVPFGPSRSTGAEALETPGGPGGPVGSAASRDSVGPSAPAGPVGSAGSTMSEAPTAPTVPTAPVGPVGPAAPRGPVGQSARRAPAVPVGAVGPFGPARPTGAETPVGSAGSAVPAGTEVPAVAPAAGRRPGPVPERPVLGRVMGRSRPRPADQPATSPAPAVPDPATEAVPAFRPGPVRRASVGPDDPGQGIRGRLARGTPSPPPPGPGSADALGPARPVRAGEAPSGPWRRPAAADDGDLAEPEPESAAPGVSASAPSS
ncbi:hypothetical protein AB0K43_20260 [Kitasatospora sp. NPDC049258]|uniref:hypothetical protein n=1 Tax=Kitasatospora sp. NPDC049258 TaxID=3155394 RepID=UPI003446C314